MPSDVVPVPPESAPQGSLSLSPGAGSGTSTGGTGARRQRPTPAQRSAAHTQSRCAGLNVLPGMLLLQNGVHTTGGLGLADTWDRIGMVLGRGYRWEIGMGAPVSPVTPQVSLETNWVSLSRLNPTNVASFGSRCLRFSQFS